MKTFLFSLLIIILLTIIISNEAEEKSSKEADQKKGDKNPNQSDNKSKSKTEPEKSNKTKKNKKQKKKKEKGKDKDQKLVPPPPLSFRSDIPDDPFNLPNDNVYLLNDKTIDKVLQNGNNYRWLVILFSETCGHCYFARTEIRKVLPEFKYSSYLRFAELEINFNPMSNMRFNIEGVPYIFMLQNNTMYLMDLYPSQKNIIKFLEMDLSYFLPEEKRAFPPPVDLKAKGWENIKSTIQDLTDTLNVFLNDFGIKYEFTPLLLLTTVFVICCLSCFLEYFCCSKFCPDEEELKEGEGEKKSEEKEKSEESGDQKNEEGKEEKSENEKIKREKEKEKEKKEGIKKKEDDKNINNKKANKKKKKE